MSLVFPLFSFFVLKIYFLSSFCLPVRLSIYLFSSFIFRHLTHLISIFLLYFFLKFNLLFPFLFSLQEMSGSQINYTMTYSLSAPQYQLTYFDVISSTIFSCTGFRTLISRHLSINIKFVSFARHIKKMKFSFKRSHINDVGGINHFCLHSLSRLSTCHNFTLVQLIWSLKLFVLFFLRYLFSFFSFTY